MNEYTPISLLNTSLNISEEHHYSYTISPLRKQFGAYYRFLEYYTIHITNERLILESYTNNDLLSNFYRFYAYLPHPDNLLAVVNKSRIHQVKKSMELIKYKSISLDYNYIDSINSKEINGQNIVQIKLLIDTNHEINSFKMLDFYFFKVFPVQKITFESLQDIFSKNDSDANCHFSFFTSFFLNRLKKY
jgi:hypothetical protein